MNPLTQSKNEIILPVLIALMLGCFAFSPQARATCREGCGLTLFNTFLGADALMSNTTGTDNTAIGSGALAFNTTGFDNTANGAAALFSNTTGHNNTANGAFALLMNTDGSLNTAVGDGALVNNTTGAANTAVGFEALRASTGNNNIAFGFQAGQFTTGDNNIDIGHQGAAGESGVIRIGTEGTQTATFIAGIRETPLAHGVAVAVGITADGQLGVRTSSARFKEAIKPMGKGSEAIFSLQPVTFRYKKALDFKATPQFGLVAEQVAKVNPDLVARDADGRPYTVRYEEVNAMLLNEFLKEHRAFVEEQHKVQKLEAEVTNLLATVKEQASQIQKVSEGLEVNKPAPQTVLSNQ